MTAGRLEILNVNEKVSLDEFIILDKDLRSSENLSEDEILASEGEKRKFFGGLVGKQM